MLAFLYSKFNLQGFLYSHVYKYINHSSAWRSFKVGKILTMVKGGLMALLTSPIGQIGFHKGPWGDTTKKSALPSHYLCCSPCSPSYPTWEPGAMTMLASSPTPPLPLLYHSGQKGSGKLGCTHCSGDAARTWWPEGTGLGVCPQRNWATASSFLRLWQHSLHANQIHLGGLGQCCTLVPPHGSGSRWPSPVIRGQPLCWAVWGSQDGRKHLGPVTNLPLRPSQLFPLGWGWSGWLSKQPFPLGWGESGRAAPVLPSDKQ